jgi:cell division septation protein DedD
MDLSHAAARVIGLVGPGTLPVRLRVLAGPAARSAGAPSGDVAAAGAARGTPDAPGAGEAAPPGGAPATADPGRYAVQVAAFGDEARAAELRARLQREGRADVAVDRADRGGVVLHRVRVGSFPTRSAAEAEAARLAGAGHAVIIVDR